MASHPMSPSLPRSFPRLGRLAFLTATLLSAVPGLQAEALSREAWGAPAVKVSQQDGRWLITGRGQTVSLNPVDLAMHIQAGPAEWKLVASAPSDLRVKAGNE